MQKTIPPHGWTVEFKILILDQITKAVVEGDNETVINYTKLQDAAYAVPTPDHYLPLLYCLGAADGDSAEVFNKICNLGSMAMTGYIWG